MKPQWDDQIAQLDAAVGSWRTITPKLPAIFTTAQGVNVPTEEVGLMLEEMLATMKEVGASEQVNGTLLGIHQAGVLNQVPNISAAISQLEANPGNPKFIDQIAQSLWSMRSSIVWILPSTMAIPDKAKSIDSLDFKGKIAALESLSSQFSKAVSQTTILLKEATSLQTQANASLEALKGFEREGATAKTNAEAGAVAVAANKEAITEQLAKLTEGIAKHQELLSKVDDLQRKATTTLESTSKVALAASFSSSRKRLQFIQSVWGVMFFLGIAALLFLGIATLTGNLLLPPLIINNQVDWGGLAARIFLAGPLVWLGWFSARQYGHTLRLIEDYAFKEASALAFVGYQREMSADQDMIKLLRESAIRNFGSEPSRVFVKSDPASPLHELVDKALEKGAFDKLLDLVKALKPGK